MAKPGKTTSKTTGKSGGGVRALKVRVKTAGKRSLSSKL